MKCTCRTAEQWSKCNEPCGHNEPVKTKRHPSEITPDEFFELAKIVDPTVKNKTTNEGV